jgi:GT2 family glycosyltransferase
LSRNSSSFTKQNELIRSLRKQLDATERELADQRWLFQQFMQSPSWRLTYPIRWLARQARTLRAWSSNIFGSSKDAASTPAPAPPVDEAVAETSIEAPLDLKQSFTDLYRVQFQSFLASRATLQLPVSANPELSVIVVLFNRAELTFACLRSLAENYSERMEVIIVDNNSRDETSLLLDRLIGARIIRNDDNLNFLLAVNQAAAEARGEYLLLLNNDAQVMPGTLRASLNAISGANDIGAVGGRLILLDGTLQEAGSIIWDDGSCLGYGRGDNPFAPMYMFRRDVDSSSTGFLLTPREVFHRVGGFTDEMDYCRRLTQSGMRVVYEPGATVLHHADDRVARDRSSPFPQDAKQVLNARMADRRRRILCLEDRPPHRWLGTGYPRAHAILDKLLSSKFFVTFYPLIVFDEEWSEAYTDISREVEIVLEHGPDLLEEFLSERRGYYETILVSRPHNMKVFRPILEKHPDWFEDVTVIYDAEAVFATRDIARRKLSGSPMTEAEATAAIKSEIELASAADLVISVSESERETFVKNGIGRVDVLGHAMRTQPSPNAFEDRAGFLFVGAIKEVSPNSDSVIWFVEEILPIIQARLGSQVRVTIAGVCDSARVRELASPGVRITGIVDDLSELYNQARVFIAPTRYSAGLPYKVHEAAAHGLPTVVTPLLADQLKWRDGFEIAVGMDARSFAEACVRIHENRQQWQDLRTNALARVERECSVEEFDRQLERILRHSV